MNRPGIEPYDRDRESCARWWARQQAGILARYDEALALQGRTDGPSREITADLIDLLGEEQ